MPDYSDDSDAFLDSLLEGPSSGYIPPSSPINNSSWNNINKQYSDEAEVYRGDYGLTPIASVGSSDGFWNNLGGVATKALGAIAQAQASYAKAVGIGRGPSPLYNLPGAAGAIGGYGYTYYPGGQGGGVSMNNNRLGPTLVVGAVLLLGLVFVAKLK